VPTICPRVSGKLRETLVCDKSWLNISCSDSGVNATSGNMTIRIGCGFYGVHPVVGGSCGIASGSGAVVYFERSMEYVRRMCEGRSGCELSVGSASWVAGSGADAAGLGIEKALYVQWWCENG